MTKTVADAAMMLQTMAGPDPHDPTAAHVPVPDYMKALTGDLKGLRIGVPTNYFFDGNAEEAATVRKAVEKLHEMGARIVDVDVPHANLAGSAGWIIAMAEGAASRKAAEGEPGAVRSGSCASGSRPRNFTRRPTTSRRCASERMLMDDMRQCFEKCDVMAVPGGGPRRSSSRPNAREATSSRLGVDAVPGRHDLHRRHDRPAGDCHPVRLHRGPAGIAAHHPVLRESRSTSRRCSASATRTSRRLTGIGDGRRSIVGIDELG